MGEMRDGRLFQFEVRSISVPCVDSDAPATGAEAPSRQIAHFWLCGGCSDRVTLVLKADAAQMISEQEKDASATAKPSGIEPYAYMQSLEEAGRVIRRGFQSEKLAHIPLA